MLLFNVANVVNEASCVDPFIGAQEFGHEPGFYRCARLGNDQRVIGDGHRPIHDLVF